MSNVTRATMTIEYGEEEFQVSPLGLRELEELETYVQGRIIAAGRDSIPEDAPVAVHDRMMAPIIDYASRVTIMGGNGFERLKTPAGIVRLFYVSLKRKHPDITLEKCRKMIGDKAMAQQIQDAIAMLNPNPKAAPPKNPPAPPTPAAEGQQQPASSAPASSHTSVNGMECSLAK